MGAPRDRGLGLMRRQRTGALYRCPITGEEFDCERVDIDGDVNLDRESKDNQWLGVTVKSQGIGGKVVVRKGKTPGTKHACRGLGPGPR